MRSKKSFFTLGIIVLVLFLGVGYAVVSSVYLNIGGTASVANADLKVEITNVVATTNIADKTLNFTNQLSNKNLDSNFTLNGMELNEKVTITYTVTNNETDVDAELKSSGVAISNSNTDYFRVGYIINDSITDLENEDRTMELEVTVELIQTPITESDGTTTVGLTLIASPKGSASELETGNQTTPLKFGQKYILTSLWGTPYIENPDTWVIFYEDGHSEEKNGDKEITTKENIVYSGKYILGQDESMEDDYVEVSDDGKHLIIYSNGTMVVGTMVLESEYNLAMSSTVKFGQEYYCIEDGIGGIFLGTSLMLFPDGSAIFERPGFETEYLTNGSFIFRKNGIELKDMSDTTRFEVIENGNTINVELKEDGQIINFVFKIGEGLPISWNVSEASSNQSVIINSSNISKLSTDTKFVKVSDSILNYGYMVNTKIKIETENNIKSYYHNSTINTENNGYFLEYENSVTQDEMTYLIVIPEANKEYFGTMFLESGIYAVDYSLIEADAENTEIIIDFS